MRRALLAAVALAAAAVSAGAYEVPYLTGRVNDDANVFDASSEKALEQTLKDYEARSGHQIAVLTLRTLGSLPLEEYSLQVARAWRLGAKGRDDGILILVAVNDRKVRIEVGDGLEGDLPDVLAGRIISDAMIPRFRAQQYAAGIQQGVDAVIAALDHAPSSPRVTWTDRWAPENGKKFLTSLLVLLILVFMEWSEIRTTGTDVSAYFWYALFLPAMAWSLSRTHGGLFAETACVAHLIGFPIAKYLMSATAWGRSHQVNRTGPHGHDAFFFGGSGGNGGGGFSGGGGSFGGGGASGSW